MRKTKARMDADDVLNVVMSWEDTREAVNFHLDEADRFGLDECSMNNGSFTTSFKLMGREPKWYASFTPKDGAKWTQDMLNDTVLIELAVKERRER